MNKLIIINGVTGAIGTACLAQFSREEGTVIYGLSRKAVSYKDFITDGYLPAKTNIYSIGDITNKENCKEFLSAINFKQFSQIIYVHAVGVYPFEVDTTGAICISNDDDGDGIDDRVMDLSYTAYFNMVNELKELNMPVNTIIFGAIADIHRPAVHTSWWTVMNKTQKEMQNISSKNFNISNTVLNISSVICPHEILTRPYVFISTNADARFWLLPHEVAEEVVRLTLQDPAKGYQSVDLYHASNYYEQEYYTDSKFTKRKIAELGIGLVE